MTPALRTVLPSLLLLLCAAQEQPSTDNELFEKKIRPLLAARCHACHSAQTKKTQGNLALDTAEGMLKGGDSGPAVLPGHPEKSLLVKAIRYTDAELRMPPPKEKARLSAAQVAEIEAWIQRGAVQPRREPKRDIEWEARKKWVFEGFADPQVPSPRPGEHPIDAFLRAKREARGLQAAPPAEQRTLLRRVTYDLTGLPPSPEELDRGYEETVERLLASPAYGERWGRHWLDLARFAVVREDSAAKKNEPSEIPEAWRYRDWVIDAFNRDLPYDQFIVHQIAGDLLPAKEPGGVNVEGIVASGFLAIGEWGIQDDNPEKMIWDTADENIDAVGRTFLGLTLGCTRCHDHKFDPLTTRDYYALAGMFTSTHVVAQPAKIGVHTPMARIPLIPQGEIDRLQFESAQKKSKPAIPMALGARDGGIPGTPYAGFHDARIRIRGDFLRLGDLVPRGVPAILSGSGVAITSGSGRWPLAHWLSSDRNPLTARVMVNRLWQHHFGEGIVRTPSNFGKLGEPPTHPELLDWLAHRFIDSGWSVKAMHRLILQSAAYRQSSAATRDGLQKDPDNRLLARMPRRRLEAEAFHDALLAVAGTLDRARGGPADPDPASRKRMIYLTVSRTSKSPFEGLFDGADPTAHTDKRTISTVAPQALFLLNHPFLRDQAAALARRLMAAEPKARVSTAYVLLYGRPPVAEEVELALGLVKEFGAEGEEKAWTELARVLLCANEFVVLD